MWRNGEGCLRRVQEQAQELKLLRQPSLLLQDESNEMVQEQEQGQSVDIGVAAAAAVDDDDNKDIVVPC